MPSRKKDKIKKSAQEPRIFDAVAKRRFGATICFLCGCKLTKSNRTDEHVIPRWVQKRFKLWDQKLVLLNGTEIPYRLLTIPACVNCNRDSLAPIENQVRTAVEKSADAVRSLPRESLFFWLGKILYGILYREHLLQLNRSSRSKRPIVSREMLRRFQLHHYFLQGSRVPIKFELFFPASIRVVHTQCPVDIDQQFDFRDAPGDLLITLRLGSVGIIAALQDGGVLQALRERFPKFRFHPYQFTELAAQFFYKSSTRNRTPKFILTEQEDAIHVIQMGLGGLSSKPIFDPWVAEDYARVLAEFRHLPIESILVPPDRVRTILRDERGKLKYMDVDEYPLQQIP